MREYIAYPNVGGIPKNTPAPRTITNRRRKRIVHFFSRTTSWGVFVMIAIDVVMTQGLRPSI
jgi:hypothetical protein